MTRHPLLYQANTRVWLTELSCGIGRPATLDDVPDPELDGLAEMGFDWVWLLSVWCTGRVGQRIARTSESLRREFKEMLPDLRDEDIAGSGFAITGYTVHPKLGGNAALGRLRERLNARGLRLMLDFVPNHTALDHPWVDEHPHYYVHGTLADLEREPQNYKLIPGNGGGRIVAHGRDPYFPGWTDTFQLDYSDSRVRQVMGEELCKVARLCDGVRCDMAMLVLPEVFERTWGRRAEPFWPQAIEQVRAANPQFLFLAEVYWGLEQTLQQQGFDYTYDKSLYDRLRDRDASAVRRHLGVPLKYQNGLTRFLENHDEPRAAAVFPVEVHKAAAVITFFSPGMRFIHQGQVEGRRTRVSAHLIRAPLEPVDEVCQQFYRELLRALCLPQVRQGRWMLLACWPASKASRTCEHVLAFAWEDHGDLLIVVVNYAAHPANGVVDLVSHNETERPLRLNRLLGTGRSEGFGVVLEPKGLKLDLSPWGYEVFALTWN